MRDTNSEVRQAGAIGIAVLVALSMTAGIGAVSADDRTSEDDSDASIIFENQTSDSETVVVEEVTVEEDGFVAVHDASLLDGEVVSSVIGVSAYLEAGTHEDVEITLFEGVDGTTFDQERLEAERTLIGMPHRDTDGDEEYDFVQNDGGNDDPYTENGEAIVDTATISVQGEETEDGDDEDAVFLGPVEVSVAGLTVSVGPPQDIDDDGIYSDLNGDSEVTVLDAVLHAVVVTAVDAGELDLSDEQADAVDVNGDGAVTYDDALEIALTTDMGSQASAW
ncbi:hypothetical protein BRC86_06475 [Halobacteriales archaeon QS_3_64_16]|nr:MAG: hypothetical protein BRC86_06475 [Halobacteriales archaeon QS_3_64_16]